MSNWLLNLPLPLMTGVILAATYLATAVIYVVVTALAVGERARAFKAISPGMLPPLAVVFALLVGFLAAQVWSDNDRARTAVSHEASALRSAVIMADDFPTDVAGRLRGLVRRQIQDAVQQEWPAMSRGDATIAVVPAPLQEALRIALHIDPEGQGQVAAQRELVGALESALEARRQRIILSGSSINSVKWMTLVVQGLLTLFTIALIHSDQRAANRIILAIFATGVASAIVLIASHSRPFTGALAVRPSLLLQVMPEVTPTR